MVDFSCALKQAMPVAVLSAIREANTHGITVKGGTFLEKVSEADTIIFDKTGTLTRARPTVVDVVPFMDENPDELLRIAACLEEHFPHSMARAVVHAASEKGLTHEETHSRVKYIVAHGISSMIDGKKVVIGSCHFVFEDEGCTIPEGLKERFEGLPEEKADFVKKERAAGRKVIMVGDGINDSPALSAADVGIAISDGAQIAREIADITIGADNLSGLLTLRAIGCGLLERIWKNYIRIVGINSSLILLGITGTIQPATSAMAHNVSTLMIGLNSMRNLVDER